MAKKSTTKKNQAKEKVMEVIDIPTVVEEVEAPIVEEAVTEESQVEEEVVEVVETEPEVVEEAKEEEIKVETKPIKTTPIKEVKEQQTIGEKTVEINARIKKNRMFGHSWNGQEFDY